MTMISSQYFFLLMVCITYENRDISSNKTIHTLKNIAENSMGTGVAAFVSDLGLLPTFNMTITKSAGSCFLQRCVCRSAAFNN